MVRAGISGWTYEPWRGVFYPEDLPHKRELEFASRALRTIEINGSFYSLQKPESYARWYAETPGDFVFSVKGSRFVTHMKKLAGGEEILANFFASGLLKLKEKLGPILWQLPPTFLYKADRLRTFLELLPHDSEALARIARKHGPKLEGRCALEPEHQGRVRHCMEVRHASFLVPEFIEMLREHQVAWVMTDSGGKWPYAEDVTADFVYARLHGPEELYVSGYSESALDWWAERVRCWEGGKQPHDAKVVGTPGKVSRKKREVFVYFDNDAKVRAPFDAQSMQRRFA